MENILWKKSWKKNHGKNSWKEFHREQILGNTNSISMQKIFHGISRKEIPRKNYAKKPTFSMVTWFSKAHEFPQRFPNLRALKSKLPSCGFNFNPICFCHKTIPKGRLVVVAKIRPHSQKCSSLYLQIWIYGLIPRLSAPQLKPG